MRTFRGGVKADAEMRGWGREKRLYQDSQSRNQLARGKLREAGRSSQGCGPLKGALWRK